MVNCLDKWFRFVVKLEHSHVLEIRKEVQKSYIFIFDYLEKLGDYKTSYSSYLKSRNALCLACAYQETPDIQLLNYALENAKICREIAPEIHDIDPLIRNIEKRIYVWPIHLG